MTPGINPIYAGLERFCPRDSKNVSFVDVGLVETCLDLIESWGVLTLSKRKGLSDMYVTNKTLIDRIIINFTFFPTNQNTVEYSIFK